MTSGFADDVRDRLASARGPLVIVQLEARWLDRSSAHERMTIEGLLARRALRGEFEHPVLRFLPHAASISTSDEDDTRAALVGWLKVIAAWKLLAGTRGDPVVVHRVISDRLHLADGVYSADPGGPSRELDLARQVSHEMQGLTRLIPAEFAAYARHGDDDAML